MPEWHAGLSQATQDEVNRCTAMPLLPDAIVVQLQDNQHEENKNKASGKGSLPSQDYFQHLFTLL